MDWEEFFGGAFESEAFYADQQTTVNWYPAKLPNGRKVLLPTPGVEELSAANVNESDPWVSPDLRRMVLASDVDGELDVYTSSR